ncbi:MAG: 4Fe-4S dicluster domain-containing protein, partial [Rhodospirillaceae bacterium]|nr:4Fe-4S dicluster domain-containing protein [Rhodospirillaceae bacterium]
NGDDLQICCTQEAPVFDEVIAEAGNQAGASYINIRETAGWSDEAGAATPKIAALIAAATVPAEPSRTVTMRSAGRVLVYGNAELALPAAEQLANRLTVTVLLIPPGDGLPPSVTHFPVFRGQIKTLSGSLGGFQAIADNYAAADPSSRAALTFGPSRNGVVHDADVIVDLSGGDPLVSGGETRDGYFRPDPSNPAAVQKALFDAADLVGEFEKPIYVSFTETLCAHSRSAVTGCTKCLDICPASAITPAGDHVAIDLQICAGCGGCASVCPTGAATYDLPPTQVLYQRLRTLLRTYRDSGGSNPVVLFHDTQEGAEMIGMMSRLSRGLPARVLPVALNEVTQLSFDILASTIAYGAEKILILASAHRPERLTGLEQQVDYIETLMSGLGYEGGTAAILDERDPEALCEALYGLGPMADRDAASFLPVGGRRSLTSMALHHIHKAAPAPVETVAMPDGAPFGAVTIDADGCTLCLACVGACPTGALSDNPDSPMLRFTEHTCIQCGLCRSTCPESVMTLDPRINFASSANSGIVLKEEEPFECVSCGKPFGARSSVERTIEKLVKHPMFAGNDTALKRLRMCEDCRVIAQFSAEQPLAHGTARRTRTTDDYLSGDLDDTDDDC